MLNSSLIWALIRGREHELRKAAAAARPLPPPRRRLARLAHGAAAVPSSAAVTIRHAFPDDSLTLLRLAALDSAAPLVQPVLVAEVEGELRAALSLRDGSVIADPFHHTAPLVELLGARAAHLVAADAAAAVTRRGGQMTRVLRARFRGSA
jgi:hypothetical protein